MSQENAELVKRAFRAATARPKPDFATMNALFHPDHVLVPVTLDTQEVVGARGYQAFLQGDAGDGGAPVSWEADFEGAVDVGSHKVLAVLTGRYRGSASGVELEQRNWAVVTVRDGLVARTEIYLDPAEALQAAALSE